MQTTYHTTSLEGLKAIVTATSLKKSGKYWREFPHASIAYNLLAKCATRWVMGEPVIHLSNDKREMAVKVWIDIPGVTSPTNWKVALGIVHSNTGHRRLKFYLNLHTYGTTVTLRKLPCDRKHTHKLQLANYVDIVLDVLVQYAMGIPDIVKTMTTTDLTEGDVQRVLFAAGRMKLMPWSRIGKVDALFTKADRHNCWGMLYAFSHVAMSNPPMMQMDQVNKFRMLLPVTE